MNKKQKVYEHIGTPAYIAPEIILEKGYQGFSSDIWSLGIMTFICLTGRVPFRGDEIKDLHHSILKDKIRWKNTPFLSSFIKDLINKMLSKDPKKRITL